MYNILRMCSDQISNIFCSKSQFLASSNMFLFKCFFESNITVTNDHFNVKQKAFPPLDTMFHIIHTENLLHHRDYELVSASSGITTAASASVLSSSSTGAVSHGWPRAMAAVARLLGSNSNIG